MTLRLMVVSLGLFSISSFAQSQTLSSFAAECDAAIGVTVPAFDCEAGTLIPINNFMPVGGGGLAYTDPTTCDHPDRLSGKCDPGSRYLLLASTSTVDIVGLCRKKGAAANEYRDVAAIQHNKVTGATCFYQIGPREPTDTQISRFVPAPSSGTIWNQPSGTASQNCVACHDNGPFIRSPYLTQAGLSLPGAGVSPYNLGTPYRFIGADFGKWRTAAVVRTGNVCNSCHRMSMNSLSMSGSSLDFGLRATATSEASKNPHSALSKIWMTPSDTAYNATNRTAAESIADCAWWNFSHFAGGAFDKNPVTSCFVTEYGPWETLGGVVVAPPSSAVSPFGDVDVVVTGTDFGIHTRLFDGAYPPAALSNTAITWAPFVSLGEPGGDVIQDPVVVSGLTGVDIFVVGPGGAIFNKRKPLSTGIWQSTWTPLGGATNSKPAAVAWGNDRVEVFVRGTDNQVYQSTRIGSGSFSSFALRGGSTVDAPAAIAVGTGTGQSLHLWVRNSSDNSLHQRTYTTASGWSASWTLHGGVISSPPYPVQQDGVVSVLVRDSVAGVFRLHNTSGSFVWQNLGGATTTGTPTGIYSGAGNLTVIARDANSQTRRLAITGGTIGPWSTLGHELNGQPAVVNRYGELLIFARSVTESQALVWSRRNP